MVCLFILSHVWSTSSRVRIQYCAVGLFCEYVDQKLHCVEQSYDREQLTVNHSFVHSSVWPCYLLAVVLAMADSVPYL